MRNRQTTTLFSCPSLPAVAQRRSRWPVFLCALVLVWCAGWYCRGESQGLLFLATGVATLSVVRTRALPGTARWVIWGGMLITVACLAANVTRLVSPENALEDARVIDRWITVAFAFGLTALFFRSTVGGVTLAAVGGLPMAMVVLARSADVPGAATGFEMLIVWGLIVLLIAADLAQRLTQPHLFERVAPGARELGWRLVFLAAVAVLAFGLRLPVEWTAKSLQKGLLGWVMYPAERMSKRRGGDLLLNLPTSANFGKRMRVILLIDAARLPGYLRESAFIRYRGGRWTTTLPEIPLKEASFAPSRDRKRGYALTPAVVQATTVVWRVEVISPALLTRFCLPGNAVTLSCDGTPPLADTNGTVAAKDRLPDTYDLAVVPRRLLDSAYPWPEGLSDPEFLEIPARLAGAVSNWVSECAGLADAPTLKMAVRRVEDHFATNFTYRLGLRVQATSDPIVDFMARKEGPCTLFASAAALMFRSCGVPSRLVNGYVCSSWNPWLKRWVVREREGHAWVEVWDRSSGRWLVVDPTPPDGRPTALENPTRVRLAFDLLAAGWKRFLAYLKGATILEVIADLGETLFQFIWQVVLSLPGAVVLVGLGAVWWFRRHLRRRELTPVERLQAELVQAMARLERRAAAAHLRRRGFESWNAWLNRIGPEVPPARLGELREWVESYQVLRYSVTLDEAAVRAWLAGARNARW